MKIYAIVITAAILLPWTSYAEEKLPWQAPRLTQSEMQGLINQIMAHWKPPVEGSRTCAITMTVKINPDGSVAYSHETLENILQEVKGSSEKDHFLTNCAEAAKQAIEAASPLQYPIEKYELVKTFDVIFDTTKVK